MRGGRLLGGQARRSFRVSPYDSLLTAALTSAATRVRVTGANAWAVKLHTRAALRAAVEADWLVLEAEPARRWQREWQRQDGALALLTQHRSLPGNSKFVLNGALRDPVLRMRVEIPLAESAALPASEFQDRLAHQLSRSIDTISAALSLAHPPDPAPADSASRNPDALKDIATLCREAGWPLQSATDSLRVTLDTADTGFRQATLSVGASGVRLLLNLFDDLPEELAPVSRSATAMLLLRAGSAVRLARPLISEPHEEFGFEVRVAGPPESADLEHALNALSLAARQSASEAEALADPRLAAAYLASFEHHTKHNTLTTEAPWATR
jgi:hypothetical protein